MEQKPESFSSRWIAPEPVLVERFDIISHEAEFVASQLIQVIPRIDSGVVQVIENNPETFTPAFQSQHNISDIQIVCNPH